MPPLKDLKEFNDYGSFLSASDFNHRRRPGITIPRLSLARLQPLHQTCGVLRRLGLRAWPAGERRPGPGGGGVFYLSIYFWGPVERQRT